MGRDSIIKAYHHHTPDISNSSKPKSSECSCYKESCLWLLYAMITLSLGMAVLTFWLSLYREQEQRIEFLNLEKSYNDSVNQLKVQLNELNSLAVETKEERGNLSRKLWKMKKNTHNHLSNLTQKIQTIRMEQSEYRRAIQDLSNTNAVEYISYNNSLKLLFMDINDVKGELASLNERLPSLATLTQQLQKEIENIGQERKEELSKIRGREDQLIERIKQLENGDEDIRMRISQHKKEIFEELNQSSKTLRKMVEQRGKDSEYKNLEQIRSNNQLFKNDLRQVERSLTASHQGISKTIDETNEKVDHFVRSIMRLKNVPQEILLLNAKFKDLMDRLSASSPMQ
ncbi:unnamed protein product [Lepeophtheirus salmonis]|uniref:(salmon louse) hypothetical protein n=1 Tax=Lepeophtheirus salmonis TaxID=72036 RepID=A0A7R8D3Y7_LEPSM|nr:unnamed protein product [Lepeophtheirus salmonis]CAF2987825.1 unnamed protein product [Lepeophtheirus salmonis]